MNKCYDTYKDLNTLSAQKFKRKLNIVFIIKLQAKWPGARMVGAP